MMNSKLMTIFYLAIFAKIAYSWSYDVENHQTFFFFNMSLCHILIYLSNTLYQKDVAVPLNSEFDEQFRFINLCPYV